MIYGIIFLVIVWLLGNHWMKKEARKNISEMAGMTESEVKYELDKLRSLK